jgi:hypothetical protein
MTEPIETVETEDAPFVVPEGHYFATIKGHELLIKEISPAQAMIVAALQGEVGYAKGPQVTAIYQKMARLLTNLIVREEDRDWLEGEILDDNVTIDDIAVIFVSRPPAAAAPATGPKPKPRRGK